MTDLRTLDAMLWERIRSWLDYGSMFSIFAAMALLLASVGLNAVIGHSASQRTQEIGIRIITGAPDYRYRLKGNYTFGTEPNLDGLTDLRDYSVDTMQCRAAKARAPNRVLAITFSSWPFGPFGPHES